MSREKNSSFESILVANRGEIACRIIRSIKNLGLRAIAVYSEADKNASHVLQADDAVFLGPPPALESYLDIEKIICACKDTGAEAVHPGYGFLSENAQFSQRCIDEGIVFIGPSPETIELMGDKARAKRRMINAGVMCIPGYEEEDQSDSVLLDAGNAIGFPLMVKAAAGGGGRGMRLVSDPTDLAIAINDARSEAESSFGAGHLILEKAILNSRHVEIQVLSDEFGNYISLGERDCSVQRRHQKIIEEAPCPAMPPALRAQMGEMAISAAREISYVGAGTIEFLLDQDNNFYFLEMNTRLQVEHPVTEAITGIDLVEQQIRIAQKRPIPFKQNDVIQNGHAIEARLYAEDTENEFLPSSGTIALWQEPNATDIRVDAGVATGSEISPYYDPMLAKIIVHGKTRDEAREKLANALKNTVLFGVTSNRNFLINALNQKIFAAGQATTNFIDIAIDSIQLRNNSNNNEAIISGAILFYTKAREKFFRAANIPDEDLQDWTTAFSPPSDIHLNFNEEKFKIRLSPRGSNVFSAVLDSKAYEIELLFIKENHACLTINKRRHYIPFHLSDTSRNETRLYLRFRSEDFLLDNSQNTLAKRAATNGVGMIKAPMHGVVIKIYSSKGTAVKKGDRVAVLEAMKMQHELTADMDGFVSSVNVSEGTQVTSENVIIELANSLKQTT